MPFTSRARCLDLFAGSGVLGFEALSRGADFCCFVDASAEAISYLRTNAELLKIPAANFQIIHAAFPKLPTLAAAAFDIVFLDPPFHSQLMQPLITWLHHSQILTAGALLYLEIPQDTALSLPEGWKIFRRQQTRTLVYQLIQT